jgi:hypothetical protein
MFRILPTTLPLNQCSSSNVDKHGLAHGYGNTIRAETNNTKGIDSRRKAIRRSEVFYFAIRGVRKSIILL